MCCSRLIVSRERGKTESFYWFYSAWTTNLLQWRGIVEKEPWKIEFLVCARAWRACIHAYVCMCLLLGCMRVCLHSRLRVCLCEFCKLFTALAMSVHCDGNGKYVSLWLFFGGNSIQHLSTEEPPAEPSHHTHVPLAWGPAVELWGGTLLSCNRICLPLVVQILWGVGDLFRA